MLAEGLDKKNDCKNLILTKQGSELAARARKKKIECQELPFRFEADVFTARRVANIAFGSVDTILHAHTPHALSVAIMAQRFGAKQPICFTRRVSFPVKNFFANRWKLNQPDRIVAVSQAVADRLKEAGVTPEKIRVIYSGVPIEEFEYGGPSFNEPLNLMIGGAVEKAKGLDLAFEFLKCSSNLPLIVHFAGDGPQLPALQEVASKNPRVKVHGFVSDLAQLLGEMFAAISFSPSEGFPNFLLQAMSSGLPVLAFENAATRELIQSNGRVGFLFQSPEEAMQRFQELMENRQQAIEMGKAASRLVQSSFSSARMVDQTFQLYKEILS